jgi:hypothetical protein
VLGIAVLLALAACTSPDPQPTPSSAVSSTSPSSLGTETASTPPNRAADATVTSAILTAYRGYWDVRVGILAHPPEAIPKELATYAVDKAAADVASSALLFRQQGIELRGEPVLSPAVTAVTTGEPATASITDCVDSTRWTPVYAATGKSALPPGQPMRVVVESTASTYSGRWVIRTSTAFRDRTC